MVCTNCNSVKYLASDTECWPCWLYRGWHGVTRPIDPKSKKPPPTIDYRFGGRGFPRPPAPLRDEPRTYNVSARVTTALGFGSFQSPRVLHVGDVVTIPWNGQEFVGLVNRVIPGGRKEPDTLDFAGFGFGRPVQAGDVRRENR
jgi:hypothetical protein